MSVEASEQTAPEETPAAAPEVTTSAPETTASAPAGASEGAASPSAAPVTSEAPANTTPEPAPQPPDIFGMAKQFAGYDFSTKYKSPEEFFKGVAHLHQLAGRKSEKERLADQVAPYLQDFVAWRQQQAQAAQQPPQPEPPAPLFAEPQLQEGDQDWVEPDPDNPGRSRVMRDAPADVKKRLLDRVRFLKSLQENPAQVIAPAFDRIRQEAVEAAKREALAEMEARWQQQQQAQQEQQIRQQIVAARSPLMFQLEGGRPVIDAATGMPVVNEYGRAYIEREQWLYEQGFPEHIRDSLAHEYATMRAAQGLNKPAPKQTPGSTKAADTSGGRVKPGEKTHGKGLSLAERIFADNPDLKPDDVVKGFAIV